MAATKTCVIVDDSEIIREITTRIMEEIGIDAIEAATAPAALQICKERKPDAVLLDWDLPSFGALDVLRGVAEMPEDERPEIILAATENSHQQFTLAKAAGAKYHVLKPFDRFSLEGAFIDAGVLPGQDDQAVSQ